MKMENRVGAMTHTCWIPVSTLKGSVSSPLPLSAVANMLSCSSLSTQMYFSGQSIFARTSQRA